MAILPQGLLCALAFVPTSSCSPEGKSTHWISDFSEWVKSLRIPLGDSKTATKKQGTTVIKNLVVHDIKLPTIVIKRTGDASMRLGVSHVSVSCHIDELKNTNPSSLLRGLLGMRTLELRNLEFTVTGSFTANVQVRRTPHLIHISWCQADSHVTAFTAARTKGGWVHAIDFTHMIGRAINKDIKTQIEAQFRDAICESGTLSEKLDIMLEKRISAAEALERKNAERINRTKGLDQPYLWSNSESYQWLKRFSSSTGLSLNSMLKPFFSGPTAHGLCVFGSRLGMDCPSQTSTAVKASILLNTAGGSATHIRLENLAVLLQKAVVDSIEFPRATEEHPEWLGMKFLAGPIETSLLVDVEIVSDAYETNARIRKTLTVDVAIEHVALETYFYYEVDASKYKALTPIQRVTPACLDDIANQFRFEYFNLSTVRIRNISLAMLSPLHGSHDVVEEDRFLKSVEGFVNAVLIAGINTAPEKINQLIRTVAAPALEMRLNTEVGFSGLLRRIGLPIGDVCPADGEPLLFRTLKASVLVTFVLALSCYVGFKAFGPRRSGHGVCLAMKRTTGLHWPFALPLFVVASVLLFTMSNTMDAASMNLYLLSDDQPPIVIHRLKAFSVFESISDLWGADMKLLSVLIVTFSVILPYLKLLLSLVIFWGPISTRAHGRIVKILDVIGKWSFLDAFTLMAMISLCSLRVPLRGGVGVALYVEPQLGFLAFIMGTCLCLAIGNILLTLHRRAHRAETPVPVLPATSRLSCFCCRSPQLAVCVFATAFIVSFVLIYRGSTINFCSIEIRGLVGWLLKYMYKLGVLESVGGFGGEMQTGIGSDGLVSFDFSVVGLGLQMQVVTAGIHPWHTIVLQITYFIFALMVPLVFLAVGLILCLRILCASSAVRPSWTRLLTPAEFDRFAALERSALARAASASHSRRRRLQTLGHTLFAWSAADVYVIGALVIVVEMGLGEIIQEAPALSDWIRTTLRPVLDMPGHGNTILSIKSSLHEGAFFFACWCCVTLLRRFIIPSQFHLAGSARRRRRRQQWRLREQRLPQ